MATESLKFLYFGPESYSKPIWKLEKELNGTTSVFTHSGLIYYFVMSKYPEAFTYLWSAVGTTWKHPLIRPTPHVLHDFRRLSSSQFSYLLGEDWLNHPFVEFLENPNPHKYLEALLPFAVRLSESLLTLNQDEQKERCLYILSQPEDEY